MAQNASTIESRATEKTQAQENNDEQKLIVISKMIGFHRYVFSSLN